MKALWACVGLCGCLKSAQDGAQVTDSGGADVVDDEILPPDEPVDPVEFIDPDNLRAGDEPCRTAVLGTVSEIVDGDTIKVKTGRGVERVRMIGIDTPEVDHSGPDDECYSLESSAFLEDLIQDKKLWLTFDAECTDDYGRTLAYVHRGLDDDDFIQRVLLRGGWASTFAVHPNVSFRSLFDADQAQAQSTNEGLWGDCD